MLCGCMLQCNSKHVCVLSITARVTEQTLHGSYDRHIQQQLEFLNGDFSELQSAVLTLLQAQRRVAQQQQPQNHVFYLEWDDCNLQGPASGMQCLP